MNSKSIIWIAVVVVAAIAAWLGYRFYGGQAEETRQAAGEVRVYNWSDYIDESVLDEFTEETGIAITYDVFDSNEVLETKLLAGGSGYDVVVPSGEFLARQIEVGIFQKLDKAKLPNLGNMWSRITDQTAKYDPGNAYSVNYMWGTTGIGFDVGKVREILGTDSIDSWETIFEPDIISQFADCGIMILNAPTEIIPATLNYLGLDPTSGKEEDLDEAEKKLLEIRPYVRKFHSSDYINALANGDICLTVGWSGDIIQARDRAIEAGNGIEISYSIPKEGALLWFDQMAIPQDAENVDAAHRFINFMMRPEIMAKASNYVYFANGNEASQPLLEDDLINDPTIYPDEATTAKLYVKLPYNALENRLANRVWTRVTTGQ